MLKEKKDLQTSNSHRTSREIGKREKEILHEGMTNTCPNFSDQYIRLEITFY